MLYWLLFFLLVLHWALNLLLLLYEEVLHVYNVCLRMCACVCARMWVWVWGLLCLLLLLLLLVVLAIIYKANGGTNNNNNSNNTLAKVNWKQVSVKKHWNLFCRAFLSLTDCFVFCVFLSLLCLCEIFLSFIYIFAIRVNLLYLTIF